MSVTCFMFLVTIFSYACSYSSVQKQTQQKMNLDCFGAGHDQQTQSTRNLLDAFDGLGGVRPIGLLVYQLHAGF